MAVVIRRMTCEKWKAFVLSSFSLQKTKSNSITVLAVLNKTILFGDEVIIDHYSVLQAATVLVSMATRKKFWQPKLQ